MPCLGPSPKEEAYSRLHREGFDMKKYGSETNLLHNLLCKAVNTLHQHALLTDPELLKWARMHERLDQQRREELEAEKKREEERARLKTLREQALSKLSDAERAALGVE